MTMIRACADQKCRLRISAPKRHQCRDGLHGNGSLFLGRDVIEHFQYSRDEQDQAEENSKPTRTQRIAEARLQSRDAGRMEVMEKIWSFAHRFNECPCLADPKMLSEVLSKQSHRGEGEDARKEDDRRAVVQGRLYRVLCHDG
jgi:hypothetical protein